LKGPPPEVAEPEDIPWDVPLDQTTAIAREAGKGSVR
jgi:hypothetical protein